MHFNTKYNKNNTKYNKNSPHISSTVAVCCRFVLSFTEGVEILTIRDLLTPNSYRLTR